MSLGYSDYIDTSR